MATDGSGPTAGPSTPWFDRALASVARSGARFDGVLLTALRFVASPLRRLVRLWRRSIQARVVIGTLTLSAVLAGLAGWVLLRQVTDGLLDSKRQAALTQAAAGVDTAQSRLTAEPPDDAIEAVPILRGIVEVLSPRDDSREEYGVVVIGPLDFVDSADLSSTSSNTTGRIDSDASIPGDLTEQVKSNDGSWATYTEVTFTDPAREPVPGLVVGSQIQVTTTGQNYGLFYVFPLQEQQDTLFVVRNALITAGSILVVLLGTIAWLVTRQVVTPVRLARRIAERLAAGRLEERMHVRGEDDIARLGMSFNQMASNLQRQIRQLEELSRVQRRFVADVSHELRTPLTTVRMAADLLHDARIDFDPATKRSAELLQDELNRFEGLLTDLLEISRFDAGAAVLDLDDVDIRDVAHQVVEASSAVAESRGSRIVVHVPGQPCVVRADVRRIERIVRNLVVNAIAYGEGKDVEVNVGASADAVALTVRDHGVGLKPGEEILVFNRFWRADPARARTRGGTGLGLSIAVEDTVLHGGVLDAAGHLGEGSVFRLTLPRRTGGRIGPSPLPLHLRRADSLMVGAPYARYPTRRGGGVR